MNKRHFLKCIPFIAYSPIGLIRKRQYGSGISTISFDPPPAETLVSDSVIEMISYHRKPQEMVSGGEIENGWIRQPDRQEMCRIWFKMTATWNKT